MIALYSILPACIHEDTCSDNVRLEEDFRIFDASVHMRLCREVDNNVGLLFFKECINRLSVCYISPDKAERGIFHYAFQSGKVSGIGQLIQTDNPVVRMAAKHMEDEVRTDETSSACNDYYHKKVSPSERTCLIMIVQQYVICNCGTISSQAEILLFRNICRLDTSTGCSLQPDSDSTPCIKQSVQVSSVNSGEFIHYLQHICFSKTTSDFDNVFILDFKQF